MLNGRCSEIHGDTSNPGELFFATRALIKQKEILRRKKAASQDGSSRIKEMPPLQRRCCINQKLPRKTEILSRTETKMQILVTKTHK
jgi:hypothetical protein